jgi:hypothetical protein
LNQNYPELAPGPTGLPELKPQGPNESRWRPGLPDLIYYHFIAGRCEAQCGAAFLRTRQAGRGRRDAIHGVVDIHCTFDRELMRAYAMSGPETDCRKKSSYAIPDAPHASITLGHTGVKSIPINRVASRSVTALFKTLSLLGREELIAGGLVVGGMLVPGSTVSQVRCSSISRATIAAREVTPSFAKVRRKCVQTVHKLMLRTPAIVLLG